MGRHPKDINWSTFEELCHIQCTHPEIASIFHIDQTTLYRRAKEHYQEEDFASIYKRFAEGGKASMRRAQYKLMEKNAAMGIWMGKQYLGQKDEQQVSTTVNLHVVDYSNSDTSVQIPAQELPATSSESP